MINHVVTWCWKSQKKSHSLLRSNIENAQIWKSKCDILSNLKLLMFKQCIVIFERGLRATDDNIPLLCDFLKISFWQSIKKLVLKIVLQLIVTICHRISKLWTTPKKTMKKSYQSSKMVAMNEYHTALDMAGKSQKWHCSYLPHFSWFPSPSSLP